MFLSNFIIQQDILHDLLYRSAVTGGGGKLSFTVKLVPGALQLCPPGFPDAKLTLDALLLAGDVRLTSTGKTATDNVIA